jgi:hypothetical protein
MAPSPDQLRLFAIPRQRTAEPDWLPGDPLPGHRPDPEPDLGPDPDLLACWCTRATDEPDPDAYAWLLERAGAMRWGSPDPAPVVEDVARGVAADVAGSGSVGRGPLRRLRYG